MKPTICILIFAMFAFCAQAQTNLTDLLQQGMFEEQANHNLNAAIADYEALSTQFNKDRQLAATAIFRLGECYREEGLTNQAAAEYQRILDEFHDQKALVTLSREDLAGMGVASSSAAENPAASAGNSNPSAPASDEDQEIARLQDMIQNSPDLINRPGNDRYTPLGNAAAKGQLKVAAFLLGHGADVNGGGRGGTPLIVAVNAAQRTMVQFLLEHGADVNADGGAALDAAIEHGYDAVGETLLAAHPDVNVRDNLGQTPLKRAAMSGSTKFVQLLLTAGANPNSADNDGVAPLSSATLVNSPLDLEPLKLFLAAKADPNGGGCDAPLLCAIDNRNTKSAELLLQAGANPNLKGLVDDNSGYFRKYGSNHTSPLWDAVCENELSMVQLLLKYKADPNSSQMNDTTIIIKAVDKTNILQALLDAGANPNGTDGSGRTLLSLAAQEDSPEAVSLLLQAKADPNAGTMDAPLLCAIDRHDLASAELLLQAGADPNVDGLMHCQSGLYGSRWFAEYSAILRKATPLWLAIQNHQLPMVQLLLRYKANPDAQTSEPPSVIFWALFHTNILQALLDGGANPNAKNGNGETPLRVAEQVESGTVFIGNNISSPDQQRANAALGADLLRQHGALETLPDWDHIIISRPSAKYSEPVFSRGTNDWNQFTLMELLFRGSPNLSFPDFTHITIIRPDTTGKTSRSIPINLLNSTNGLDCSRDVPLEFGDIVEVPEREHTLAENDTQTAKLTWEMLLYLRKRAGTAELIVDGGKTTELPLANFEPVTCDLADLLVNPLSRGVLTSDSDLSRVKVTRRDPKTGKSETWVFDRTSVYRDPSDLWIRDGDVIEVPEMQ